MRKILVLLSIVLLGTAVACAARDLVVEEMAFSAAAHVVGYQRFVSDANGAFLTNLLGMEVTGLRIVFSSPVPDVTGYGIGATVAVSLNAGAVVVLTGSVPQSGTISIVWPLGEGEITSAEWLDGATVVGAVDLHTPIARMRGTVAMAFLL